MPSFAGGQVLATAGRLCLIVAIGHGRNFVVDHFFLYFFKVQLDLVVTGQVQPSHVGPGHPLTKSNHIDTKGRIDTKDDSDTKGCCPSFWLPRC